MADEGFHEIQLSGKQLVFLFMAMTLVSVVIFLCGVLVGRGVRAAQGPEMAALGTADPGATTATAETALGRQPAGAPAAGAGDLSYPRRLESDVPAPEQLKGETPPAAPAPDPVAEDVKAVPSPPPPPGDGFTVQVAALRDRAEADAIVQRLVGKGYPVYVVDPAAGAPAPVYRVRVGKYASRREAEQIVRRLEKEEQFKPWITR